MRFPLVLCLALGGLMLVPCASQAQFFDNINNPGGGAFGEFGTGLAAGDFLATDFRTAGTVDVVKNARLDVAINAVPSTTLSLYILGDDSGAPDINTIVGTFDTMPVIDDPGLVDFFSTGITLQPNTIYWLALVNSPGSFNGWRVALPEHTGTYSNVPNTLYAPGTGQNDGDFQFQLGTSATVETPEPGSVALLVGMSTVGAGLLRKRRRK